MRITPQKIRKGILIFWVVLFFPLLFYAIWGYFQGYWDPNNVVQISDLSICATSNSHMEKLAKDNLVIKYSKYRNLFVCGSLQTSIQTHLIIYLFKAGVEGPIYVNPVNEGFHQGDIMSKLDGTGWGTGSYRIEIWYRRQLLVSTSFEIIP